MKQYVEQLEKQNYELQERLGAAERYIAWKDERLYTKLKFEYFVDIHYPENRSINMWIDRRSFSDCLHFIKYYETFRIDNFKDDISGIDNLLALHQAVFNQVVSSLTFALYYNKILRYYADNKVLMRREHRIMFKWRA
jgi:hypothetical protein